MDSVRPEDARAWILGTFPGAWEDFPFGPGTRVFKNGKGKLFVLITDEADHAFRVTVKLGREGAAEALMLPFVSVAPYLGRHGWVTVQVEQAPEWEIASDWIGTSWGLVGPGKPAKPRRTQGARRSRRQAQ